MAAKASLPRLRALGKLSETLAENNARVERFADGLPAQIDQMIAATQAGTWRDVHRVSSEIASEGSAVGTAAAELTLRAAEVAKRSRRPGQGLTTKRSLIRLIGSVGRMRSSK